MNRREALLLLAGTAALPDQLFAIGRAVHKCVRAGTLRALDPHQNETVATIAELIIPKTDTPGAREAGGPPFIDVMLADWAGDDQRQMFTAGPAEGGEKAGPAVGQGVRGRRRTAPNPDLPRPPAGARAPPSHK